MLKIYMYRESYTKKLFLKLLEKKLYVKVMSIIKSYDDSLFSTEDAQKLYLKLIFTNYKFPKVEKCGMRKLSKTFSFLKKL